MAKTPIITVERQQYDKKDCIQKERWDFGFNGFDFHLRLLWYVRQVRKHGPKSWEVEFNYNRSTPGSLNSPLAEVPLPEDIIQEVKHRLLEKVTVSKE